MTDAARQAAAADDIYLSPTERLLALDLRVLMLYQPWATLWADPTLPKAVETRPRPWPSTMPLGTGRWVLIHAAAREPTDIGFIGGYFVDWPYVGARPRLVGTFGNDGLRSRNALPLGAVIGAAHITASLVIGGMCSDYTAHICSTRQSLLAHSTLDTPFHDGATEHDISADLPYGNYTPGRYGYTTDRTILFNQPIPHKNTHTQGFTRASPELVRAVLDQAPEIANQGDM